MKNKKQCPNCNHYQLQSSTMMWIGMAIFSCIFVVTFPLAFIFLMVALFNTGTYRCKNCGWKGML